MDIEDDKEFSEFLQKQINELTFNLPREIAQMMIVYLMFGVKQMDKQQETEADKTKKEKELPLIKEDGVAIFAAWLTETYIPNHIDDLCASSKEIYNQILYIAREKYQETKAKEQEKSLETVH